MTALPPGQSVVRPCGATRPAVHDAGWECTGSGLVIVSTVGFGKAALPVVLPARALETVDPERWWDPVTPFTGGDHLHLVVPRRPSLRKDETSTSLVHRGLDRVRRIDDAA